MITLRFDRPQQTTWPVVLRFETDPDIPLPIVPPNISAAFSADFRQAVLHCQTDQVLLISSAPLAKSTSAGWQMTLNQLSCQGDWMAQLPLSAYGYQWFYQKSKLTEGRISAGTAKPFLTGQSVGVATLKTNVAAQSYQTGFIKSSLAKVGFLLQFNGALVNLAFHPAWPAVAPIAQPLLHQYGPTPSRWRCSSDYRPELGKAKIRFSKPAGQSLQLRFEAAPLVCVYLPGGGYKGNVPSTPVIDTKIPIEPQIQRAYVVQPTFDCIRVRDSQRIVISAFSLGTARGQFAMSIRCDFGSKIDADRARLELLKFTVNGYVFYGYIETFSKREVFGGVTWSGTGRSRAAELTANYVLPISYTNASSRSFVGILSDLLSNTGWTVELVGVPDFAVPARAFSITGKAPIDSIADAVGQLGLMILSDDNAKKIKVVPQFPTTPWLMAGAIPDLVVHDAVILENTVSDDLRPLCDCIFVRGEQVGVSAKVKRNGMAGNRPAADITASLIIDVQAARMAGTAALANTGNKKIWNMVLPVLPDLPPVRPGQLVGVRVGSDVFKTTADTMALNATVSDTGAKEIWQVVSLIEHLE